jgi:hypothetical protein
LQKENFSIVKSVRLPLRIQEGNSDRMDLREIYLGILLQLANTLPFWLKSPESSSHDTFVTSCRYWFLRLRDSVRDEGSAKKDLTNLT